jgi:hypothetical protein
VAGEPLRVEFDVLDEHDNPTSTIGEGKMLKIKFSGHQPSSMEYSTSPALPNRFRCRTTTLEKARDTNYRIFAADAPTEFWATGTVSVQAAAVDPASCNYTVPSGEIDPEIQYLTLAVYPFDEFGNPARPDRSDAGFTADITYPDGSTETHGLPEPLFQHQLDLKGSMEGSVKTTIMFNGEPLPNMPQTFTLGLPTSRINDEEIAAIVIGMVVMLALVAAYIRKQRLDAAKKLEAVQKAVLEKLDAVKRTFSSHRKVADNEIQELQKSLRKKKQ